MLAACLKQIRTHGSATEAMIKGFSGIQDIEISAKGAWIKGQNHRSYLDLGSFSKFLFGHSPSAIIDALKQQLTELSGTSRLLTNQTYCNALEAIAQICPKALSKIMLLNTGAEAVEAAIKLARMATNRRGIVHLSGSYHGKTAGALSITDADCYKPAVHPLLANVDRISRDQLTSCATLLETKTIAALFVEPIQGEGGIYELDRQQLQALRQQCQATGTLFVADEIQSGLGRTGKNWACEHSEIIPDILLMGKSLGAGIIPVSAIAATPSAFKPYDHNPYLYQSTYAGNPLASRVALETCKLINETDVPDQAKQLGQRLIPELRSFCLTYADLFEDVRGKGLLLGLPCRSTAIAGHFLQACLKLRLIITPCLTDPTVLRITPPICLSDSDCQFAMTQLKAAAETIQESIYAAT